MPLSASDLLSMVQAKVCIAPLWQGCSRLRGLYTLWCQLLGQTWRATVVSSRSVCIEATRKCTLPEGVTRSCAALGLTPGQCYRMGSICRLSHLSSAIDNPFWQLVFDVGMQHWLHRASVSQAALPTCPVEFRSVGDG